MSAAQSNGASRQDLQEYRMSSTADVSSSAVIETAPSAVTTTEAGPASSSSTVDPLIASETTDPAVPEAPSPESTSKSKSKKRKAEKGDTDDRKRVCRFFLEGGKRGVCIFGQKDLCRNLHVTEDSRCVRCLSRLPDGLEAHRAHWSEGCLKSLERTQLAGDPRDGLCPNFPNGCCSMGDAAVASGDASLMCPLRHTRRLKEGSRVLVCVLCGKNVGRGGASLAKGRGAREMVHMKECLRYKELHGDRHSSEKPECGICARPFYGVMAEVPPGKRVDGSSTLFKPLPPPPLKRLLQQEKEEVEKDEAAATIDEATSGFRVYAVFTNCFHAFCLSCTSSLEADNAKRVRKCPSCRNFNAYIPVNKHFDSRELLKKQVLAQLALRKKIPCKKCKGKPRPGCPYNHSSPR